MGAAKSPGCLTFGRRLKTPLNNNSLRSAPRPSNRAENNMSSSAETPAVTLATLQARITALEAVRDRAGARPPLQNPARGT